MTYGRLKLLFLSMVLPAFLVVPVGSADAFSLFPNKVCNKTDVSGQKSSVCAPAEKQNPAARLINSAANIIALLAGVAAVIMIIIAGFAYVSSGGNAEQTTNAKNRIINAVIGLVIIALAWTIVRLVTDRVIQ